MFTDIELLQLKNAVSRILHVPGNYTGGVLEMAIVADYNLPVGTLHEECRQIADMLKKQNETFRNVRLNLIRWISDTQIEKEVIPLSFLLAGRAFADEAAAEKTVKTLDELFRQLKLFYARSKVILVLTDGSYRTENKNAVKEYLQPFLARKLLLLQKGEQIPGIRLFMA
ncbi:MAG: hypothetical protein K2I22_08765 [Lachnospiraceae bacterium]|nr:hypothetical protein [Lachnospiraceae bacterium]